MIDFISQVFCKRTPPNKNKIKIPKISETITVLLTVNNDKLLDK